MTEKNDDVNVEDPRERPWLVGYIHVLESTPEDAKVHISYLKVKVKSLAREAQIIRAEEKKHSGAVRAGLANHRKVVVRREARNSLLALAYLRGRAYRAVERSCRTEPGWDQVERMVKKYGPPRHNISFNEWRNNEQEESVRRTASG